MSPALIVDTSALLATLLAEPSRDAVLVELAEAETVLLSSCCALEASIVTTSRLGVVGQAELDHLLDIFSVEVVAFTADHAALAAEAWRRFGKGRHPAALNLGDCMTYAIARLARRPLLCVGDDFRQTDLDLVPLPPSP